MDELDEEEVDEVVRDRGVGVLEVISGVGRFA